MKVFINPGHDTELDSGAVNYAWNVRECDVVSDIGELLAECLEDYGCEVMVLQQDNLNGESGSYSDSVCQQANNWDADLFVSLHCNAFNFSAYGCETLVYELGGASDSAAQCIQDHIVKDLKMGDRGVKARPDLIVLKRTAMPAVLVEMGFIDNEEDVRKLITKQEQFAEAIAKGVADYFNGLGD